MPIDYHALIVALSSSGVRFVVVGGLALVLHGIDRLTADADVVVDLQADALGDTVRALTAAGYRPLAPVDPAQLADAKHREAWQRDKGMKVFSFWDSGNARPTVDILLECPVAFEELWRDAQTVEVSGTPIRIASAEHLIRMKSAAGRARDLDDIAKLRSLVAGSSDG